MERRGGPADRSHDIAQVEGAFCAYQLEEGALTERMVAMNGGSRTHHVAMYEFRPPGVADVQSALAQLTGTLDFLTSEVETRNDGAARQITVVVRDGDRAKTWSELVSPPVWPKPSEGHPAQAAAEAALAGRSRHTVHGTHRFPGPGYPAE